LAGSYIYTFIGLAKKKAKYLKDIADTDRGSAQAMSDVQNMENKARKELIQLDLSFDEQVRGPSNRRSDCFIISLNHLFPFLLLS
jgi:hypothetical protein